MSRRLGPKQWHCRHVYEKWLLGRNLKSLPSSIVCFRVKEDLVFGVPQRNRHQTWLLGFTEAFEHKSPVKAIFCPH